jgi:modified peptide precursor CbpA
MALGRRPVCASESPLKKTTDDLSKSKAVSAQPAPARPDVIAIRKSCDAEGTGLSHYVLMDKQVKQ